MKKKNDRTCSAETESDMESNFDSDSSNDEVVDTLKLVEDFLSTKLHCCLFRTAP